VVIKVGTAVITTSDAALNRETMGRLAHEIAALRAGGRRVALVSSGAIGAGLGRLGVSKRPSALPHLQAAAAVGQARLMLAWEEAFAPHDLRTAQILLTWEDFDHRDRYLNVRNTIHALWDFGAIPVINENDTVSVDEVKFGDNDVLSALVTNMLRADCLVLLSVVEGLLDPATKSRVPVVQAVNDGTHGLVEDTRSAGGSGGMGRKLDAAARATEGGEPVVIAKGTAPGILERIFNGEDVGTLFLPKPSRMQSRKRWIGLTARPQGVLVVDAGARRALETGGKSLLPGGVRQVVGRFEKGDVVAIRDETGLEFARGVTNYPAADIARIQGLKSREILKVLGSKPYDEVVHRDNLVLVPGR
jgi:glutamate 5-kinase